MNKFKEGDKVKVNKSGVGKCRVGEILVVKKDYRADGCWYAGEGYVDHCWINAEGGSRFELVKEEEQVKEFDMKTQPWFIRVSNEQEYDAVKDWLVNEKGLEFAYGLNWYDPLVALGNHVYLNGDIDPQIHHLEKHHSTKGYHEIKLTFKTVIDAVEWPVVESEPETVELKGKKYIKSELEKALKMIKPVGE
jgi:hypothetical protein